MFLPISRQFTKLIKYVKMLKIIKSVKVNMKLKEKYALIIKMSQFIRKDYIKGVSKKTYRTVT